MLRHKVFVGAGEAWGAGLPGVREEKDKSRSKEKTVGESSGSIAKEVERGERMKIAWRYERLGGLDIEQRGASYIAHLAFPVYTVIYAAISSHMYNVKNIASDISRSAVLQLNINTIFSSLRPDYSPRPTSEKPPDHIYST
jgi:hypothetical protein